mmetsp:Transcript_82266/g.137363  ORF Transcript_82266/g.137363 Transcript_82266/m.137363 type:complete len:216 (+) Transcript_82266:1462-2109(+)
MLHNLLNTLFILRKGLPVRMCRNTNRNVVELRRSIQQGHHFLLVLLTHNFSPQLIVLFSHHCQLLSVLLLENLESFLVNACLLRLFEILQLPHAQFFLLAQSLVYVGVQFIVPLTLHFFDLSRIVLILVLHVRNHRQRGTSTSCHGTCCDDARSRCPTGSGSLADRLCANNLRHDLIFIAINISNRRIAVLRDVIWELPAFAPPQPHCLDSLCVL